MKKILVDAHCFSGSGQGMVSYLQGIYSELLKDEKFEITFACSDTEKIKAAFGENANVIKIPNNSFLYRLFFFFPKVLKAGRFDYAHFQYLIPFFLSKNVKYIATIHDIIPIDFPKYYSFLYRFKVAWLFRRAAKKSDILLTVSEYSKNRISKRFCVPENKVHITENAVKDIFESSKDKENRLYEKYGKYFLYVSRIEERKNHITLLKAFIDGEFYKNYSLLLVGSRSSKTDALYKYYDSLPLERKNKIVFLSNLSDDELNDVYNNAELFIYPSIAEGFGIPPLEAAVCLKKVCCSNSSAMKDFDFFKKYSFEPLDENGLINQIKKLLLDENYPAQEIKDEILKKYSWKKSAENLKRLLLGDEK